MARRKTEKPKRAGTGPVVRLLLLLLLVSLVLGCLAGELLRIDDRLSGLGDAVEKRVHIEGFSQGFITASIITCVGSHVHCGSAQ